MINSFEDFRNGDEKAFNEIFNEFYQPAYRFVFKIVDNHPEAEDIVIQGFSKIWENRIVFNTKTDIQKYLYTITRNASFNYLRNAKVRQAKTPEILRQYETRPEETKFRLMSEADLLQLIYNEIEKLPPQCSKVMLLLYFNHWKPEEVAKHMGISINTVHNQRKKGKAYLESIFKNKNIPSVILYILLFGVYDS